ncbi:DUF3408 domain-containing protein [Xylanibacter rodentium]|uniref:DUF3408 domain-containing protein n=2 Tax=Bacteroidia TaxID=200643 RepID=A0A1B1S8D7_9BACT|nr:DUF3408 domain-containing protein [Xylanibacter rodentium]ANU63054.1 hypothetical protein A4V02_04540 [Muribaculum intestinale]GFI66643.1 hypothetical protein IMSAG192_00164 [Muribaculaceae bacterium]ASB38872.1 hypothetical protein ADH68_13230 [Muribaculum intestinale]PWB05051.1 DUF3408 domain-containing protein [Muribaculum intestinale]PWB11484.1 DUF3408 domain-containing protein [Muribaculum intestinale]
MIAKKSPSTTASKSTKLTDATKSKVSTSNPEVTMKSDNSINSTIAINATTTINSDNAVNNTTPANADNLFDNEQTATEATSVTATTEPPKQQRIGKQQRKSDYADFKATFLTPSKLMKRHPVNIEDSVWAKLERIARILGDRDTTVGSYINAVLSDHLRAYSPDIEVWRKL